MRNKPYGIFVRSPLSLQNGTSCVWGESTQSAPKAVRTCKTPASKESKTKSIAPNGSFAAFRIYHSKHRLLSSPRIFNPPTLPPSIKHSPWWYIIVYLESSILGGWGGLILGGGGGGGRLKQLLRSSLIKSLWVGALP